MSKKIIINKTQLDVIKNHIVETTANVRLKNKINDFLIKDYEPTNGVKKMGNEFYDEPLIKKKIDDKQITPKALSKYLRHKFNGLSTKEINNCIKGWFFGDYNRETGMRKK